MSEIVLLENAPTRPDPRQFAQLWFAENQLRTMRGHCPRAAHNPVVELLKLAQDGA